jgi:hypothetical protein
MAYLKSEYAEPGGRVAIDLGKVRAEADICALPIYTRP